MKIYRIAVSIIFIIACIVFMIFFLKDKVNTDNTYPVISIEGEELKVSLEPTDEELKAGVTAYDAKDGDITEKVIVESISSFSSKGVCNVTYAVVDNNNYVTSATRKIVYEDYQSPRFTLSRPLLFSVAEKTKILDIVGAEDCIDGDISLRVIANTTEYNSSTEGVYYVSLQVSNSKGDTIYLELPVEVASIKPNDPVITLSKYIEYIKVGDSFNPQDYVVSAVDYTENSLLAEDHKGEEDAYTAKVKTESYVNTKVAGTYYADYYISDEDGREGRSRIIVIVEE